MAVADSGVKAESVVPEFFLYRFDYLVSFLGRNITGAVVHHDLVLVIRLVGESYEICPQRNVRIKKLNAHACRLKRRTSGVALLWVKAENAHIGNVAAGL